MPEVILFRQLTVETARISGPTLQLFTDTDRTARRVTEDPEHVLVRWLMDKETVRKAVLEELRRDRGSFTDTAITHPLIENTNRKPGHIDLLICDPNRPHESLVVEWKCVKVSVRGDGTNQVDRLDDVGGGVAQANALYELGFFQLVLGCSR